MNDEFKEEVKLLLEQIFEARNEEIEGYKRADTALRDLKEKAVRIKKRFLDEKVEEESNVHS